MYQSDIEYLLWRFLCPGGRSISTCRGDFLGVKMVLRIESFEATYLCVEILSYWTLHFILKIRRRKKMLSSINNEMCPL
jgi:hypothetical protein